MPLRKACIRLGHVRDPSYGVLRVASKHRESVLLRRDLCGNQISDAPRHRRDVVPVTHWLISTVHRFWNDLFGAMKLLPRSLLADRGAMQNLADFSMPIIRTVDALVGGVNAMRVDAKAADGDAVTLRVAHGDLEDCVGQATAAFGMELLRGGIAPGCWYPAELPVAARDRILAVVEEGAIVWEV